MPFQREIGGEHRTGYIKTLVKSNELMHDLQKMEFLSTVVSDPNLKFSMDRKWIELKKYHKKYKVVLKSNNRKK